MLTPWSTLPQGGMLKPTFRASSVMGCIVGNFQTINKNKNKKCGGGQQILGKKICVMMDKKKRNSMVSYHNYQLLNRLLLSQLKWACVEDEL